MNWTVFFGKIIVILIIRIKILKLVCVCCDTYAQYIRICGKIVPVVAGRNSFRNRIGKPACDDSFFARRSKRGWVAHFYWFKSIPVVYKSGIWKHIGNVYHTAYIIMVVHKKKRKQFIILCTDIFIVNIDKFSTAVFIFTLDSHKTLNRLLLKVFQIKNRFDR